MERIPPSLTFDPEFEKLRELARVGALTDAQRRAYDKSLKIYRDNYAIAETERNEGIAEGLIRGREEGRAEGRAIARAEGEKIGRYKEKCALALKLIEAGVEDNKISIWTELSPEQIADLRKGSF